MGSRSAIGLFVLAIILGVVFTTARNYPKKPTAQRHANGRPRDVAKQLKILNPDGSTGIQLAMSEGPGLWLSHGNSSTQVGVHGDGTPFLIVGDAALRNFGLGRMDGRISSPILVFRTDDIVRMVFGLSMTETEQSPFLVHWTKDGKKSNFLGHYCDDPERVCTK